jgi:undecaprenyl-diphosphatase
VDAAIFSAINGVQTPWLDPVMTWASWLGYFPGIWFLSAAAALAWPRLRASAFRACLAVALTYVVASGVVKPIMARPRPYQDHLVAARTVEVAPATGYSFPSGHAATAVAGALAGGRIVPALSPFLWGLAALMSVSRIYVGVHYPSDILGGAVLGLLCTYLVLGGRHASVRPWPRQADADRRTFRP